MQINTDTHQKKDERRLITVLHSDLANSIELIARIGDEAHGSLLRRYQITVEAIAHRYDGTIIHNEREAVQVCFGFPSALVDGPERAVRAAWELVHEVSLLGHESEFLSTRVGVSTGSVVIGDFTGERPAARLQASGRPPNLAKRLRELKGPNSIVISEETNALVNRVVTTEPLPLTQIHGFKDPVQAFLITQIKSKTESPPITRLIARDIEREQLKASWRRVKEGEGVILYIYGEAGIGKSSLIDDFLQSVPRREKVRYQCHARYQYSMLHPLVRKLKAQTASGPEFKSFKHAACNPKLRGIENDSFVLPVFKYLLQVIESDTEIEQKYELNDILLALTEHLSNLVRSGVTVFVIEDIHWADPTTLELLNWVVQLITKLPFLLVITSSTSPAPSIVSLRNVQALKLSPLSFSDAVMFINEQDPDRTLSFSYRRQIVNRSEGVPLHLRELTASALSNGDLSFLNHAQESLPDTLQDSVVARLDQLESGTELAQIATIYGCRFTSFQINALLTLSLDDVVRGLDRLVEHGILIREDVSNNGVYQFSHSLIAGAAYATLSKESRRKLHTLVTSSLEQNRERALQDPNDAAFHYEAAGIIDKAIHYREIAGFQSSCRSAIKEAVHHFSHAIELVKSLPDTPANNELELRLRLKLGTQLVTIFGNAAPQVGENLHRVKQLCENVSNKELRWEAYYGLWSYLQVSGRLLDAEPLGEIMIALSKSFENKNTEILAYRAHGLCLFSLGKFSLSAQHLEGALSRYNPRVSGLVKLAGISDAHVLLKSNLAWLYCFTGKTREAIKLHNDAISQTEKNEDDYSLANALALSAASYQTLDNKVMTKKQSLRLVRLSISQDYPYYKAWGQMLLAWSQYAEFPSKALREFDQGIEAYDQTGAKIMNTYFFSLRAELDLAQNNPDQALARLEEAETDRRNTSVNFYQAELHRLRAVALYLKRRAQEAGDQLILATNVATIQGNKLLLDRIDKFSHQLYVQQ